MTNNDKSQRLSDTLDNPPPSFYAELEPLTRHLPFVDHLFLLRDCGRLIHSGGNLFSSPLHEISLVCRSPLQDTSDDRNVLQWTALQSGPRFGRRPRRRAFHGWVVGVRCRTMTPAIDDETLAHLVAQFAAAVQAEMRINSVVAALDLWVDQLMPWLGGDGRNAAFASREVSRLSWPSRVADLANEQNVTPRTVQRQYRKRFGLPPKQYLALWQLTAALSRIAGGRESLTEAALAAGYFDQSHLSRDFQRHCGLSPGRLRLLARRQKPADAVRILQDAGLQRRANLVIADFGLIWEDDDDGLQSKGSEF